MLTQRLLLPAAVFFDLVNRVLEAVGRQALPSDSPQHQIIQVRDTDRVLQILAGPGSGKTEMLVWRVLYELFVVGTASERIMLTTFTRRAATELSVRLVERSDELIVQARAIGLEAPDPHIHDLRVGTIHSLCDSLLAEFDLDYMAAGTEVIDENETRVRIARVHRYELGYGGAAGADRVIDRLLAHEELVSLFRAPWAEGRWPGNTFERVSFLMGVIAQHTETWIPRGQIESKPNGIESLFGLTGLTDDLTRLQERWEGYLDKNRILDFTTIQHRFWLRQGSILQSLDHVFVDEFQDTNPIQLAIHIGWLASPTTRLTVVGDDDQAVYRFRGSDIRCFTGLEGVCTVKAIAFRQERLEENWRSTRNIINFTESFRRATVLGELAMPKEIRAPAPAHPGDPVRLLQGPWEDLSRFVADEIHASGAGRTDLEGEAPMTAILMFSASEKESRRGTNPALDLHRALVERGLRVYNPRNKTAARAGSPIHQLAGAISYFFDPVVKAPAGSGGRPVEVWASQNDPSKSSFAPTNAPGFPISAAHAQIQKQFIKQDGRIGDPGPSSRELLAYLDQIRDRLIEIVAAGKEPRLTLSGLVARLLSFPQFRGVSFSHDLFRQALFTQLLESNIAPTRLTMTPLDRPLRPERQGGKVTWPNEVWQFLNIFGGFMSESDLDDVEVDELAEHAIAVLTFHQAKGLEFDRVYVGLTGRDLAPHSVLLTKLFSGEIVPYSVDAEGQPSTTDAETLQLSAADREREVYVALTRAKSCLTILHDPDDQRPMTALNQGLGRLFEDRPPKAVPGWPTLSQRAFDDA